MFDDTDDTNSTSADMALRRGLADLPTPAVSADFDARIQAALLVRPSRLQTLWTALRPAVPSGVCTLCATLLLLHVAQQLPPNVGTSATPARIGIGGNALQQANAQGQNDVWNELNLSHASLRFLNRPAPRLKDRRG